MSAGDEERDQKDEKDDPSKGFGTERDVNEDAPPPTAGFGTGASAESMLPTDALGDPSKGFGTSTAIEGQPEEAPNKDSKADHEA